MIRQPIVTIMGHVDHGKTSLLDKVRGTAIAAKEAGGITQAIGASIIPKSTIQQVCGKLLEKLHVTMTIPGLLFIDTPGHAAFVNLRKRGGNLADIAIVVIDINEGLMPQTKESIEILKQYKTPFILAANKIDLIEGWRAQKGSLIDGITAQSPQTSKKFETKLYELVAQMFELGIQADRFDRVSDYTKQAVIVPISAKTGEGIPELLMMLTGLAQKYLEQKLQSQQEGPAKGTVLEVKEQKGLGTVLDVILYDGSLAVNDQIIIATPEGPVQVKVKALLEPVGSAEMREKKAKFVSVKKVTAATGVRLVAPGAEKVVAGMPLISAIGNSEKVKEELQKEVAAVLMETGGDGIAIKADSLGSLEALFIMLKEKQISVRKSSIGSITKNDISQAEAARAKDPLQGIILGFNIPKSEFVTTAQILVNDVMYRLIEEYEAWTVSQQKQMELNKVDLLVRPAKVEVLKGYVFRQSNPAIVGAEIMGGVLKSNTPLMTKEGKTIGVVKGLQVEQENVERAQKGKQVAMSLPSVTIGRQVSEGDIVYSSIPEDDFRKLKEYKEYLTEEEKSILKEIAEIMRRANAVWGI